jgi:hypothetical protein
MLLILQDGHLFQVLNLDTCLLTIFIFSSFTDTNIPSFRKTQCCTLSYSCTHNLLTPISLACQVVVYSRSVHKNSVLFNVHPILATCPAHCCVLYIIILTIRGDLRESHILFLFIIPNFWHLYFRRHPGHSKDPNSKVFMKVLSSWSLCWRVVGPMPNPRKVKQYIKIGSKKAFYKIACFKIKYFLWPQHDLQVLNVYTSWYNNWCCYLNQSRIFACCN